VDESGLIRNMVMDAITNDYEDFTTIVREVRNWATEGGLQVEIGEVADALMGLIDTGLAKAYRLSSSSQTELEGRPDADALEDYYYLLTSEGRAAVERGEAENRRV
jgi:aryl-alcohol dehydrogenase-like predicted oxidoreductase